MKKLAESKIRGLKRTVGQSLLRMAESVYRMASRWIPGVEPKPLNRESIRKVLVVNLLRIGDTVVATPAIHAIKDTFPDARLTLVGRPMIRSLLAADPAIDEFISPLLRLGGRTFDLAVVLDMSLWGNVLAWSTRTPRRIGYDSFGRGFLLTERVPAPDYWNTATWDYPPGTQVRHQVDSWLDLVERIGIKPKRRHPRLFISDSARERARAFIAGSEVEPTDLKIAIHPGSSPSYRWRAERLAAVADALINQINAKIFITGSRGDGLLAKRIASRMSAPNLPSGKPAIIATGIGGLDLMTALIAEMDLVISVDTCATHIGSAVGTPVVALFGPGDPRIWRPYGPGHVVVRAEGAECLGCKKASCFRVAHFCMDGITTEAVIAAAGRQLKSRKASRNVR